MLEREKYKVTTQVIRLYVISASVRPLAGYVLIYLMMGGIDRARALPRTPSTDGTQIHATGFNSRQKWLDWAKAHHASGC